MKGFMTEKQASSEIAQSRAYLESIRTKTYACRCVSCLANLEEAAERDTRERRDKEWVEFMQSRGWDGAVAISKRDFLKLAERIRGGEK